MPFTCKFCGKTFCSDHRLPENHDCSRMKDVLEEQRNERIIYSALKDEERGKKEAETGFWSEIRGWFRSLKRKFSNFLNPGRRNRMRRNRPVFDAMKQSFPEMATFSILGLLFVGFVLQITIPNFTDIFSLVPSKVLDQPWRIISTIFLHGGSYHLFVNSLVLFFFGAELEKRIGTSRFLKIFFSSGIIASVGYSLWVYMMGCPSATCAAVGASGALYGVFAALAVIAPEIRVLVFFVLPMGIRTALVGFALFDLFLLTQPSSMIASTAHLTGLVVGLYFGYRLRNYRDYSYDLYR